MVPVVDYQGLVDNLTRDFKRLYRSRVTLVRMVGIVFASPHSPLAKSEINSSDRRLASAFR